MNGRKGFFVLCVMGMAVLLDATRTCERSCFPMPSPVLPTVAASEPNEATSEGLQHRAEALTNAPATLHNVFRVASSVYSGSQPVDDRAFSWLSAQGIKTIVSVDGAKPDVTMARRHGLGYVHLPLGYDGIPTRRVAELVTLTRTLPAPVYVHCHHGMHRGPAAAALLCRISHQWTADDAESFLKQAGTSADYAGLFRGVREFRWPDDAAIAAVAAPLPEVAATGGVVESMVLLDRQMELLKQLQKAGWHAPRHHPDLSPRNEATLTWEQLRELRRLPEVRAKPASFDEILLRSMTAADELRKHLTPGAFDIAKADEALLQLSQGCVACHRTHRN